LSALTVEPADAGPWARYWARSLDLLVSVFIAGFIAAALEFLFLGHVIQSGSAQVRSVVDGVVLLPFAMGIDTLIYALCGNTLGKTLAGIRVLDLFGQRLDAKRYLGRDFKLYFYGIGAGLPIIALFTLVHSYRKARKGELLSWDLERGTRPTRIGVGIWRVAATALLYMASLAGSLALAVIAAMGPSPDQVVDSGVVAVNKLVPKMIDASTRLDGAERGPGLTIQYNYTVLSAKAAEAVSHARVRQRLHDQALNNLCTNDKMKPLKEAGATLRYRYADTYHLEIGTVEVVASDCLFHSPFGPSAPLTLSPTTR
jgi:hypothetical protein